jgi:hypothetical protein
MGNGKGWEGLGKAGIWAWVLDGNGIGMGKGQNWRWSFVGFLVCVHCGEFLVMGLGWDGWCIEGWDGMG